MLLFSALLRLQIASREAELDDAFGSRFEAALVGEAAEAVTHFLEERLGQVILTYVPSPTEGFLCHSLAALRSFLDGELPPWVDTILLKKPARRTAAEIHQVECWVAERWWSRMVGVARTHLSWIAPSTEPEETTQEFFQERPRKVRSSRAAGEMIVPGVRGVIRSYVATRMAFWPYLRLCFMRFCWRRARQILREGALLVPLDDRGSSNKGPLARPLADAAATNPGGLLIDDGWREQFAKELEAYRKTISDPVRRLIFEQAMLEGKPYKDVRRKVKRMTGVEKCDSQVRVAMCRCRAELRARPGIIRLLGLDE